MYDIWDEWQIRSEMCKVGRRLYELFFVAANDGNISARLNENEILVTPSGVSKGAMNPEDMVKITPDGEVLHAREGVKLSSEFKMHLAVYRARADIRAAVHAHPPTATGFAVAGIGFDQPFLPEVVVRTGPTPLVPYTIPGGDELATSILPFLQDHDTLLLGNHGILAYSTTLTNALYDVETLELNARIYLTAHQLGKVNFLTDIQVKELRHRYDS